MKESHIVIPVLIHDRLYRLRQTAREGPATGLRKIERTYPQLARVANPYHCQYLYILASEINIVCMTNMRFSIVLMLPPTSYIPLHSRWGQN